jgi:hypothetical protein
VQLHDGATVTDVLTALKIPVQHAGVVSTNDQQLEKSAGVRDGQELSVFAPLAGGL